MGEIKSFPSPALEWARDVARNAAMHPNDELQRAAEILSCSRDHENVVLACNAILMVTARYKEGGGALRHRLEEINASHRESRRKANASTIWGFVLLFFIAIGAVAVITSLIEIGKAVLS